MPRYDYMTDEERQRQLALMSGSGTVRDAAEFPEAAAALAARRVLAMGTGGDAVEVPVYVPGYIALLVGRVKVSNLMEPPAALRNVALRDPRAYNQLLDHYPITVLLNSK